MGKNQDSNVFPYLHSDDPYRQEWFNRHHCVKVVHNDDGEPIGVVIKNADISTSFNAHTLDSLIEALEQARRVGWGSVTEK